LKLFGRFFQVLRDNISELQTQRALNYLVTGEDGKEYECHIANSGDSSSSILDRSKHKEMSPGITYTSTVTLKGITLTRIFEVEHLDIGQFDALVLDT
jgi:hypothetical protein